MNNTESSEEKRISVVANTVKQRQIISRLLECFKFAIWIPVPFCLFEDIFMHKQN